MKDIFIIKASGRKELFSKGKLKKSLIKSGASYDVANMIINSVGKKLKSGMSSSDIYDMVIDILFHKKRDIAIHYNLRRGIMGLGPTGHPFEKFIGEILKLEGYKVKINQIISGRCVTHEVDVIAEKDDKHIMVEAKFHNQVGIKSDVKVAMYVYARFLDIENGNRLKDQKYTIHEPWLVTNTKLTTDAIRYANCVGMKAVAWNYPKGKGIEYLIEKYNLHPVTSIISLTKDEKRKLLDNGIVVCGQIYKDKNILYKLGFKKQRIEKIFIEIRGLFEN